VLSGVAVIASSHWGTDISNSISVAISTPPILQGMMISPRFTARVSTLISWEVLFENEENTNIMSLPSSLALIITLGKRGPGEEVPWFNQATDQVFFKVSEG
jgi:hypothetical protein